MKFTDLNLFIARLGKITKNTFIPNIEEIVSKKLSNMYLLINGVKPSRSGYAKYAAYPYGKKKAISKNRMFKSRKKMPSKIPV